MSDDILPVSRSLSDNARTAIEAAGGRCLMQTDMCFVSWPAGTERQVLERQMWGRITSAKYRLPGGAALLFDGGDLTLIDEQPE
jgi:hypothetical protein